MSVSADRLEQLAQVAIWYYEDNLSLDSIAKRLDRSVSMVSRMLQEARDRNLIEIRVRLPVQNNSSLEAALCDTFSLRSAHVLADHPAAYDRDMIARRLGEMAARYVQQQLAPGIKIGLGWGTHVFETVNAMPYVYTPDSTVIQISGAFETGDPTIHGSQITLRLAHKLDAQPRFLYAPLLVDDPNIARRLMESRGNADTLALARKSDMVIVGVGTPYDPSGGLQRSGYINEMDLTELKQAGAIGDIVGFHLNEQGAIVDTPLNSRVVGILPDDLRAVTHVVVVSHGPKKVAPLLAALRGKYMNVVVTDASTASAILNAL